MANPASAQEALARRVAILTGSHSRYQAAAEALKSDLESRGVECTLVELPDDDEKGATTRALERLRSAGPTIVAAAGEPATKLALRALPDTRVVYFMVPNAADAEFVADAKQYGQRAAGVAADVSPEAQLDWIARLQPGWSTLAVLHTASTRRTVEALRNAAKKRTIDVVGIDARIDDFAQALDALTRNKPDAVLMLPDPQIYNTPNVKELILWGLREKKPVWTFSGNIVKAGALAGQSVEPAENGREAAEVVLKILDGTNPTDIGLRYCTRTTKAVNENTAERLGISLDAKVGQGVVRYGASP